MFQQYGFYWQLSHLYLFVHRSSYYNHQVNLLLEVCMMKDPELDRNPEVLYP